MEDGGQADVYSVAAQLDDAHAAARRAYAARDVAAYVETFHPELEYTQRDGRTIGRDQLALDIRTQLERVEAASTEFQRERIEVGADAATETLEQRATYQVRAFGVLHRSWEVQRKGRYEWTLLLGRWRLRRVTVLEERVRPLRTWLGHK
jgi:hypothetical protein